ncbi:hypothetical protein Mal52_01640 [Symmachiella dynata]|uniref:Uncharacterized protein n=1 Tax=Symmachiella dynata TaxID=2527995 RepID=A0A517ZGX3_9PLAN|nr:hypothetical protein Mal52_01640 [Symmachiella dynata]
MSPGCQADPVLRCIDLKCKKAPWDLLAVSNQPDHHGTDDGPASEGYAVGMLGKNRQVGTQPTLELVEITDVSNKFGTLLNRFEET